MFPSTSSWETSGLSGKQNSLFPSGPYIKCITYSLLGQMALINNKLLRLRMLLMLMLMS